MLLCYRYVLVLVIALSCSRVAEQEVHSNSCDDIFEATRPQCGREHVGMNVFQKVTMRDICWDRERGHHARHDIGLTSEVILKGFGGRLTQIGLSCQDDVLTARVTRHNSTIQRLYEVLSHSPSLLSFLFLSIYIYK